MSSLPFNAPHRLPAGLADVLDASAGLKLLTGRYSPHGQETRTEADHPERLQNRQQAVWRGAVEAPDEAAALGYATAPSSLHAGKLSPEFTGISPRRGK
jgi:hypothetical protein